MTRLMMLPVAFCVFASACCGDPPSTIAQPPAQWIMPRSLDQRTYSSPSRRCALWVNPSDPDGKGKAFYRLAQDGKVLWEKDLPFTWRDVAVAYDGTTCGYAYTEGVMGLGNLEVAILAPSGALRLDEKHARKGSRYLHTDPDPKVAGWFMDAENDRLVVRVPDADVNKRDETWWVYSLSTGARRTLTPAAMEGPVRSLVDAKPLKGTPLLISYWYRFDIAMGSTFTLVDLAGKPVWRFEVPDDYESGKTGARPGPNRW